MRRVDAAARYDQRGKVERSLLDIPHLEELPAIRWRLQNLQQLQRDGVVIMPDGTKYVSSVVLGGVSRIRPGQPAELIAQNIPNAASMCYDAGASQLVIPLNANNGLAFISIK